MKKILVIGEFGIDRFVYGNIERLNPEAPTPILVPTEIKENWGMAGNVHKNLESLKKFKLEFISNYEPAIKTRYVDLKSNYILLRTDQNDNIERISKIDKDYISSFDAVVVSDYNKGFLLQDDLAEIFSYAKLSFMDTKKSLDTWCMGCDWIKINEHESKNPSHNRSTVECISEKLIITLGGKGASHNGKIYPTEKTDVIDVVGAGDTFMSAFVYAMLENKKIDTSINFANECASKAVKKKGVTLLADVLK
jgi:D-beta-D-heptose 7-phosphate kinase/D-beta-D-heptose 1-phosphate adenosyltransferase